MSRLRNYARLEIIFFAAIEHWRLLADAVENVFIITGKESAPQIRSVPVGTESNQISGRALSALDAMADERHRKKPTRLDTNRPATRHRHQELPSNLLGRLVRSN